MINSNAQDTEVNVDNTKDEIWYIQSWFNVLYFYYTSWFRGRTMDMCFYFTQDLTLLLRYAAYSGSAVHDM